MKKEYTIKKIRWESDAKLEMYRWDIYKFNNIVGSIYPSDYKAKFSVMLASNYKTRYVAKFETALNHIKNKTKNIYPLAEVIKKFYK